MSAERPDPPHGIHILPIPTPFLVGRVNLLLLEGPPLTLFDTGPNSGKSLDELEQALSARGAAVEDLELIVLTHQHVDHTGLLEILARRSGAQVAASERLSTWLAAYPRSAAADDAFAQGIMRRHGVPEDIVTALGAVTQAYRGYGSRGNVDRALRDGDELEIGARRLTVWHRPGHSPTDTIFHEPGEGLLIGGDHLLARISSNPLISRPPEAEVDGAGELERPRALLDYIASLRATREMPLKLVLPGHGEPITEHAALIDERLAMHDRRAAKILRMLAEGPLSAFEIAQRMWGNIAVTQAYLTLSEVLGHLDLLVERGQVAESRLEGISRFAPV